MGSLLSSPLSSQLCSQLSSQLSSRSCYCGTGALSFLVVLPRRFPKESMSSFSTRLLRMYNRPSMQFAFKDSTGEWGLLRFMSGYRFDRSYIVKCYMPGCTGNSSSCVHLAQLQIAGRLPHSATGLPSCVHMLLRVGLQQLGYSSACSPAPDPSSFATSSSMTAASNHSSQLRVALLRRQIEDHKRSLLGACHRFVRFAVADDFSTHQLDVYRACQQKDYLESSDAVHAYRTGKFAEYFARKPLRGPRVLTTSDVTSNVSNSSEAASASRGFFSSEPSGADTRAASYSFPSHANTQFAVDMDGNAVPFVPSWAPPQSDLPLRFAAAIFFTSGMRVPSHSLLHASKLRAAFRSWEASQDLRFVLQPVLYAQPSLLMQKLRRLLHDFVRNVSCDLQMHNMAEELQQIGLVTKDGCLQHDLHSALQDVHILCDARWLLRPPRVMRMLSAAILLQYVTLHHEPDVVALFHVLCQRADALEDAEAGIRDAGAEASELLSPAHGPWVATAQLRFRELANRVLGKHSYPCKSLPGSCTPPPMCCELRRYWRQECRLFSSSQVPPTDTAERFSTSEAGVYQSFCEVAAVRALLLTDMHSSWPPPLSHTGIGGIASYAWPVAGSLRLGCAGSEGNILLFEPDEPVLSVLQICIAGASVSWLALPVLMVAGVGSFMHGCLVFQFLSPQTLEDQPLSSFVAHLLATRHVFQETSIRAKREVLWSALCCRLRVTKHIMPIDVNAHMCRAVLSVLQTLGHGSKDEYEYFRDRLQEEFPCTNFVAWDELLLNHTETQHPEHNSSPGTYGCLLVDQCALVFCRLDSDGIGTCMHFAYERDVPLLGVVLQDLISDVANDAVVHVRGLLFSSTSLFGSPLPQLSFELLPNCSAAGSSLQCEFSNSLAAFAAQARRGRTPFEPGRFNAHNEPSLSRAQHTLLDALQEFLARVSSESMETVFEFFLLCCAEHSRFFLQRCASLVLAQNREPAWRAQSAMQRDPQGLGDVLRSRAWSDGERRIRMPQTRHGCNASDESIRRHLHLLRVRRESGCRVTFCAAPGLLLEVFRADGVTRTSRTGKVTVAPNTHDEDADSVTSHSSASDGSGCEDNLQQDSLANNAPGEPRSRYSNVFYCPFDNCIDCGSILHRYQVRVFFVGPAFISTAFEERGQCPRCYSDFGAWDTVANGGVELHGRFAATLTWYSLASTRYLAFRSRSQAVADVLHDAELAMLGSDGYNFSNLSMQV